MHGRYGLLGRPRPTGPERAVDDAQPGPSWSSASRSTASNAPSCSAAARTSRCRIAPSRSPAAERQVGRRASARRRWWSASRSRRSASDRTQHLEPGLALGRHRRARRRARWRPRPDGRPARGRRRAAARAGSSIRSRSRPSARWQSAMTWFWSLRPGDPGVRLQLGERAGEVLGQVPRDAVAPRGSAATRGAWSLAHARYSSATGERALVDRLAADAQRQRDLVGAPTRTERALEVLADRLRAGSACRRRAGRAELVRPLGSPGAGVGASSRRRARSAPTGLPRAPPGVDGVLRRVWRPTSASPPRGAPAGRTDPRRSGARHATGPARGARPRRASAPRRASRGRRVALGRPSRRVGAWRGRRPGCSCHPGRGPPLLAAAARPPASSDAVSRRRAAGGGDGTWPSRSFGVRSCGVGGHGSSSIVGERRMTYGGPGATPVADGSDGRGAPWNASRPPPEGGGLDVRGSRGDLLSHRVSPAVPSALEGLTSGFGM